mgnify:CR=1 FL=1|jgi:hypothetical protein
MMVKPFENKTFDLLKSDVILNPVIKDGLSITPIASPHK